MENYSLPVKNMNEVGWMPKEYPTVQAAIFPQVCKY